MVNNTRNLLRNLAANLCYLLCYTHKMLLYEKNNFTSKSIKIFGAILKTRIFSMRKSNHCLYHNQFTDFLADEKVFGNICGNYHGNLMDTQMEAWETEISIMKEALSSFGNEKGQIIFEYDIPRLGKRIDVVLLFRGIIFCIEFKVGKGTILEADVNQVLDYALDLTNFHKYSDNRLIVPILLATEYTGDLFTIQKSVYDENILNPLIIGKSGLQNLIKGVIAKFPNLPDLEQDWINSPYAPTPTIIEAARTLYESHSVEEITRHEADKVSTDRTISCILNVIKKSKEHHEKSICFVTGVPGAGKTLVGLEVAIRQTYQGKDKRIDDEGAVYLSGNDPLVAVLTEALANDNHKKCKGIGDKKRIADSRREVGKFINKIHRYRDNMLAKIKNPVVNETLEIDTNKAVSMGDAGYSEVEHVVIFDEAQRSWTHKRLAEYLKRGGTYGNKLKVPNFPVSEAEFLIWSLDQRKDWATIVCLVGGGQEIHTGEAGISDWIKAVNNRFPHWEVYISPKLTEPEYAEGKVNELLEGNRNVTYEEDLHLGVNLRSFRAEKLSAFVHMLLTFNPEAKDIYQEIRDKYPLVLTRNMESARRWIRNRAMGTERTGILVTKEAARFKPLAVQVLAADDENIVHWFLEDKTDIRSSNYLEDAATEIQVQGLELDYACLLWDADMRYESGKWHFYKFNGQTKWNEQNGTEESKQEQRKYMLNAYRVLLTRARKGLVICVPEGNANKTVSGFWEDSTRIPEYYDGTYQYLKSLGLEEI